MKALTICQPYAHLILTRSKQVENRTWPTSHRGALLIHAGKSRDFLSDHNYGIDLNQMTFGAVIAQATLVDCIRHDDLYRRDSRGDQLRRRYPWMQGHEHAEGPFCFVLENVVPLPKPVPWRGAQGLFDIDGEELERATHAEPAYADRY